MMVGAKKEKMKPTQNDGRLDTSSRIMSMRNPGITNKNTTKTALAANSPSCEK